jgi:putative SOS response-associated peptidase YedK
MCGRYALKTSPADLVRRFGLADCADYQARYNIPPGTDIPVIRHSPAGERVLHLLRWGLLPNWAKDPGIGAKLNNARGESVADKPSFRGAFARRRCLIPADGFYEWQSSAENSGAHKQPYYISPRSGECMAFGGLWESWRAPDGAIVRTCCVITTTPNAVMQPIHERMPVIVAAEHWQDWLTAPAEDIRALVAPCPDDWLQAWPVDRRVSNSREDDAGLIVALEAA